MKPNINIDQFTGILRIVVPAILSWVVARGWLGSEQMSTLASAIVDFLVAAVVLASVVWSFMRNSTTTQIAKVAAMPEVEKIVTDKQTANVTLASEPKVVSR